MSLGLSRFEEAQEQHYIQALSELKAGFKRTHWMWFIFPQIKGLGYSEKSKYYALQSMEEAKEYLSHPVLGSRLRELCQVLLGLEGNNPTTVFGQPDDQKLQSCMTLFALADEEDPLFTKVLDKFFDGKKDPLTEQFVKGMLVYMNS